MNPRTIVKKIIPKNVFIRVAPRLHLVEAVIAQIRYRHPSRGMQVIGVTGTDGKTTTCSLIASVLRSGGNNVGVITTAYIDYGDGNGMQPNTTQLTTGNAFALNRLIAKIKQNNVDWLIIETSSHALHQHRVWGIPFTVAVMTNMSIEHLDYHGTFDKYRQAKQLLFKQCNKNTKGMQTGIINHDDEVAESFAKKIKNPVHYGLKGGEFVALDPKSNMKGSSFKVDIGDKLHSFHTKLLGDFNIYNALAAIAVGHKAGLKPGQIKRGLDQLDSVKGRMMPIDEGQNFKVLIDYAVTPWAFKNVLGTIRNLTGKGRVHIVFGATGDRDKTKRPDMGRVASELADLIYLTNDETYTEDAQSIQEAVMKGVHKDSINKVTQFSDRGDAIVAAVNNAKSDDVVIITGMGHQTTINMGGKRVAWSDIDVAKKAIKDLSSVKKKKPSKSS